MSVISVSVSKDHTFSKPSVDSIVLVPNLGVEGDCHYGPLVMHRSRVNLKPRPENLRQVHLIHSELFGEFSKGDEKHNVEPGHLGENITTIGINLLDLSTGTKLHFLEHGKRDMERPHPIVRLTGVRNPCYQINKFQKGLQEKCVIRDENRKIVHRKAGVMSVVEAGGEIRKGYTIFVEEPDKYEALEVV
ncbi:hypothetical protein BP5796_06826 [Coleophoma crateriformis]|uniref:MOSC domain-containing protein n=1 Tax=Coleophoma crateriformis TaxID=565419 RepID=A0A3D8RPS5_9HELO|nr:hypothetical protein BP5796_06826 [Coleophoma crateriformis]